MGCQEKPPRYVVGFLKVCRHIFKFCKKQLQMQLPASKVNLVAIKTSSPAISLSATTRFT
jgi:hypothetical protein